MASVDWVNDCMYWRKRVLDGLYAHWCHDWDELPVDITTPEITCCHCYSSNWFHRVVFRFVRMYWHYRLSFEEDKVREREED